MILRPVRFIYSQTTGDFLIRQPGHMNAEQKCILFVVALRYQRPVELIRRFHDSHNRDLALTRVEFGGLGFDEFVVRE
jgi:hypothetical protein